MTSHVSFTADRLFEDGAAAGPILGIDTSSRLSAAAIVSGGAVLAESAVSSASHCAGLPRQVSELLKTARLSFRELRGFAVGLGPGSYTGLRVGLSYVKGLAQVLTIPAVGVSSLDALALAAAARCGGPAGSFICPVVDARKGEIYAALYRVGPDALEKVVYDLVTEPAHFLPHLEGDLLLVGDAKVYETVSALEARGLRPNVLDAEKLLTIGRFVAALGAARVTAGESDLLAMLEPRYVRPIEATFKPVRAVSPIPGRRTYGGERGNAGSSACRS